MGENDAHFQPSLPGRKASLSLPGVKTPGYSRSVPMGRESEALCHKALCQFYQINRRDGMTRNTNDTVGLVLWIGLIVPKGQPESSPAF